jgi:hypothetical protein
MEIFYDDNRRYQKWIKQHRRAFVINTKPEKGNSYRVAHLADCKHIVESTKSTKYYIKICGTNPQEIARWFASHKINFEGDFHECGKCNPGINILIKNLSILYGDEVAPDEDYVEGSVKRVLVNKYERNAKARKACLAFYGYSCVVCKFNFLDTYGDLGKNFIHVHHEKAISEIGRRYRLDPIKDLKPLCPNCHSMAHAGSPLLSINELRKVLEKHRR